MLNELDRPLGLNDPPSPRGRGRTWLPSGPIAGVATSLCLLSVVAYAALRGSPDGGHAMSVGKIVEAAPAPPIDTAKVSRTDTTGSLPKGDGGVSSAAEVERASGVRVTRGSGAAAPGAVIIHVEDALGKGALSPAPDARLAQRTKLGVLPKVGSDGSRPSDVYARPYHPDPAKAASPKIALMVSGLGLSPATTRDALDRLPGAVTFAFAPYGAELEAAAAKAREGGHETVLQLPMEPIDSAHNDPGPHTLQLAASASETDADLQWLLSRFTGYFAVSPFLGGRFLQSGDALAPVLRDAAARGLALVEDGTPVRSALAPGARDAGLPTIAAAVRLDADGDKGFDAALARLESAARKDGFALGTASALPGTVERLAKFIAGLENRGIVLVPASAGATRAGAMAGIDAAR